MILNDIISIECSLEISYKVTEETVRSLEIENKKAPELSLVGLHLIITLPSPDEIQYCAKVF